MASNTGGGGGGTGKQFKCKMVLLGEMAVGKSSLVMRFARGQFRDYHEPTIGAAFVTQTVQLADGASVKFEIWDTAGQERYHALAPMYYRGAHAALVVYDVTNAESFDRAKAWVAELQKQASADVVVALTGNKTDLAATSRAVNPEEAQAYAEQNCLLFMETSARTGLNVPELFLAVAQRLRMALTLTADQHQQRGAGGMQLSSGADGNGHKRSCCGGSAEDASENR